jgi:NADH:ubiquinone reductase (H+-translocating)
MASPATAPSHGPIDADVPRRDAWGGTLVLGGGFAGATVAAELGRDGATLVSLDNFMLFTPLLPQVASGTVEPRHVVVPLRQMCPHAELMVGRARRLDEQAHEVLVETDAGPFAVRYEDLVIAMGAVARLLPLPGLAEHALPFKKFADAIRLRNHVLAQLEDADTERDPARARARLTFVFVGGGYAGVEALGELHDLVNDAMRFYPSLRRVPQRWVLVEALDTILPEIPHRLGEYAARELRRRGIEILTGTRLDAIDAGMARLSDGSQIATHTLVWAAGNRPSPAVGHFGLPLDERGRLRVEPTLRVEGRERVWALGDNAAVPNTATPGKVDPPTSQHALRQARRLARNLMAVNRGEEPRPHRFRTIGEAASLGRFKGIAKVLGLELSGGVGWFATRSYHLTQLPLMSRRLRVVSDWTLALLFPRDIVQLGTLGYGGARDPAETAAPPQEG